MKYLVANFKSNKNVAEIADWISQFKLPINFDTQTEVILCPPFPFLTQMQSLQNSSHIKLGVQDVSSYPSGSYTGAVSTRNISDFRISYAIVGHSERRTHFHETSSDVANKIRECIAAGISPIVCVTKDEINTQANMLEANERAKCIVAFEPVEHIGTGESDTLEHILETKSWVKTAFGDVPYLYGGSVNPSTTPDILRSKEIDGFLVGSASLDAKKFSDLLFEIEQSP